MSEEHSEGSADQAKRGQSQRFVAILEKVAKDPGVWYEIAYFRNDTGAEAMANALKRGRRQLPPGQWEFEIRKFDSPDGIRHSRLYARMAVPSENGTL